MTQLLEKVRRQGTTEDCTQIVRLQPHNSNKY
jgi:hypothetical protein